MTDFFQNGIITTLHNLTNRSLESLEGELCEYARERPMGLILPCLYSELEHPALADIVTKLSNIPYISDIIIGLDQATEAQYHHAVEYFSVLPQRHHILWNDGPRLQAVYNALGEADLAPVERGKGSNVWYCMGYALSLGHLKAVALHDCDIKTYDPMLVARLFYPVANPNFQYQFCKGYYARVTDTKLNGRVARLLVSPLIRAMKKIAPGDPYLDYLDSFRYPLAGEFALNASALHDLRIPSDWSLEVGLLSEMYRNYSTNRICQVEIADTYDHKHQNLSADDASKGLSRMSMDIAKSLFKKLATFGVVFDEGTVRTAKACYYRIALDLIESYANDATMNGLTLDRHQEEKAVEVFASNILKAGEAYLKGGDEMPFMPTWQRVSGAFPGVYRELQAAVEQDAADSKAGANATQLAAAV